jgi:hypothetical protein
MHTSNISSINGSGKPSGIGAVMIPAGTVTGLARVSAALANLDTVISVYVTARGHTAAATDPTVQGVHA